jgi:hypothetical protein
MNNKKKISLMPKIHTDICCKCLIYSFLPWQPKKQWVFCMNIWEKQMELKRSWHTFSDGEIVKLRCLTEEKRDDLKKIL